MMYIKMRREIHTRRLFLILILRWKESSIEINRRQIAARVRKAGQVSRETSPLTGIVYPARSVHLGLPLSCPDGRSGSYGSGIRYSLRPESCAVARQSANARRQGGP